MTTNQHIATSLEKMFLDKSNIYEISTHIGRDARKDMYIWASKRKLDDYESIRMNYMEVLNFVNIEFYKTHKIDDYEINMSAGNKYPKYYIESGVEQYKVKDFRIHNTQQLQNVIRSDANFRYGNKIKKWESSLYKRHYDKYEHESGLGDTRELNTIERGYNMDEIYSKNPYESSDSVMYYM
jgi:hypothetical protein